MGPFKSSSNLGKRFWWFSRELLNCEEWGTYTFVASLDAYCLNYALADDKSAKVGSMHGRGIYGVRNELKAESQVTNRSYVRQEREATVFSGDNC